MNTNCQKALKILDSNVGHHTDRQRVLKLYEEVGELQQAVRDDENYECRKGYINNAIIDECSDVLAIAYHIAVRNGYTGSANDLFNQAGKKMKERVKLGERDYKKEF